MSRSVHPKKFWMGREVGGGGGMRCCSCRTNGEKQGRQTHPRRIRAWVQTRKHPRKTTPPPMLRRTFSHRTHNRTTHRLHKRRMPQQKLILQYSTPCAPQPREYKLRGYGSLICRIIASLCEEMNGEERQFVFRPVVLGFDISGGCSRLRGRARGSGRSPFVRVLLIRARLVCRWLC